MKVTVDTQPNPNSHARYSFVVLQTEGWKQVAFVGRDGKKYEVEGYVFDDQGQPKCPTDICRGFCCNIIPFGREPVGGSCRFVNSTTHQCTLHEIGGLSGKPISCVVWPRTVLDIDKLNMYAERFGVLERCPLRIVEVTD